MAKHRDLDRGDVLPASWTDAIQEFISTQSANLKLTANGSNVEVVAGAGDDQVALGIDGLWRWVSATVSAAAPAGGAQVYNVWAVASANSFADTPDPDTDLTDYTFGLQVLPAASTPSGNHNGSPVTAYRKIGEAEWTGSTITTVTQTVGSAPSAGSEEAFITPTFQNSWVDFGSTEAPCGYYKDSLGRVHFQGAVKNGSLATATIFTLPDGYRPAGDVYFVNLSNSGTNICVVKITAAGVVSFSGGGQTAGSRLHGVNFRVA